MPEIAISAVGGSDTVYPTRADHPQQFTSRGLLSITEVPVACNVGNLRQCFRYAYFRAGSRSASMRVNTGMLRSERQGKKIKGK
jgi:hypothetical protein